MFKQIWRDGKHWVLAIGAMILFTVFMIANQAGGTSEPYGEVYTASYTYCGAWSGVGGTRHCSLYLTGTERRQNTHIKGLFFDVDSYKVVDK